MKIEEIANSLGKSDSSTAYRVQASAIESPKKLAPLQRAAGRFILAANFRAEETLSDEQMLAHYKGQQAVESRPTQRPTLRWIFQCFQAIHVLDLGKGVEVSNLEELRELSFHLI